MTNLPRVMNLNHLTVTTKICLTGRAHLQHPPSRSPPPASPRICAVAQLRPVSIPDIVRDMAGKNPQQKLADFDRYYMPDGVQEPDVSVTGNTGEHRSNLKRKAKGIARSLAKVFAYLTFNTSSLNESKKLLGIFAYVSFIMSYSYFNYMHYISYMHYTYYFLLLLRIMFSGQLDFQPADITHSSFRRPLYGY
jgi:hypothetical protein